MRSEICIDVAFYGAMKLAANFWYNLDWGKKYVKLPGHILYLREFVKGKLENGLYLFIFPKT